MNWNGKRVLVTGAEGFIGSHVVKRLLAEGSLIHALVKKGSSLWRLQEIIDRLVVVESDITDSAALKTIISPLKPQIVFHLAALVDVSRSWELIAPLARTNIMGTINLLSAVRESPLEAFIYTSSSEEYGDAQSPIPETQRESPISPYSFSKVAGTHLCQMAARTFDLPVTVLRLFPTYGPFQESSMFIPSAIRELLSRKEFSMSPGEQLREFNYVSVMLGLSLLMVPRVTDVPQNATPPGEVSTTPSRGVVRLHRAVLTAPPTGDSESARYGRSGRSRWSGSILKGGNHE